MERIEAFAAGFKFGGDAIFYQSGSDRGFHLFEKAVVNLGLVGDFLLECMIGLRFKEAKGELLQFVVGYAHSK